MVYFLDIDGVMVHANPHRKVELEEDGFYKFSELAIAAIQAVFNPSCDEIILSSSHRYKYSLKQWKRIFERRGIELNKFNIIDNKQAFQKKLVSRRAELEQWIENQNLEVEELVIIDDDKSLNDLPKDLKSRLVLTKSYVGLLSIEEIKKVLNF